MAGWRDAIDPMGAVVLTCDGGQLQVSSHVLALASPVFAAMFGPHFKEGNTLATSSSVDISLPDDDLTSMIVVCKVLHHKQETVPDDLLTQDATLTAKLTKLCDKYDVKSKLRPMVTFWIGHAISDAE
jgi:hypothetical protein